MKYAEIGLEVVANSMCMTTDLENNEVKKAVYIQNVTKPKQTFRLLMVPSECRSIKVLIF